MKLLDEEMDGVAHVQRGRLQTIEEELEDVKRRLGRIWQVIETTDIEMADASERIRERKEKLKTAAEEARKLLSDRRQFQNNTYVYRRLRDTLTDDEYYPTYRNPQSACIFQRKPHSAPQESNKETYVMSLDIPLTRMYRHRFLLVELLAVVVVLALVGVACGQSLSHRIGKRSLSSTIPPTGKTGRLVRTGSPMSRLALGVASQLMTRAGSRASTLRATG